MSNLNDINNSTEKIYLCNEKIQKENILISNNVKRISALLKEMEFDEENIQHPKCTAEIENAVGKVEMETNRGDNSFINDLSNSEEVGQENYTKFNKILYQELMFFGNIFLLFSIGLFYIQSGKNNYSDFMQIGEKYIGDIGYFLAMISAIYTVILEGQEWFINRFKNSTNRILRRMVQNFSNMPLFLLACSMPLLILIKMFVLFPEWTNIICVVTFIMQIKIINHKIKKKGNVISVKD